MSRVLSFGYDDYDEFTADFTETAIAGDRRVRGHHSSPETPAYNPSYSAGSAAATEPATENADRPPVDRTWPSDEAWTPSTCWSERESAGTDVPRTDGTRTGI
ncbi:hypothetical protein NWFMUON74_47600 [Nocardia wallacei]|uniref:Uncharacterized protein n=1 Tax=Nocardia wallacei TaxID=480035 RepID=A0A7G1KP45_9NOCA|nr:hypothetical protein NWFMUON74_47600 [Nocardia wallacei]